MYVGMLVCMCMSVSVCMHICRLLSAQIRYAPKTFQAARRFHVPYNFLSISSLPTRHRMLSLQLAAQSDNLAVLEGWKGLSVVTCNLVHSAANSDYAVFDTNSVPLVEQRMLMDSCGRSAKLRNPKTINHQFATTQADPSSSRKNT